MSGPADSVKVRRDGNVAIIEINNPPVNALSKSVRTGLLQAALELGTDQTIPAVVISGGPGRFIAGADLREMNSPVDEPVLPDVVAAIAAINKPVIAALDGAALGGGLEIALACDLRIGTKKVTTGLTETRLGIIPGAGGVQRLTRLVGVSKAISLIGEARILSAVESQQAGILDDVIEGDVVAAAILRAPGASKRPLAAGAVPARDPASEETVSAGALKRAKGLPAIAEAIRLIQLVDTDTFDEGFARERAAFLRLRESNEAKALRYVFLAERQAWKVPGMDGAIARPVARCAVIGAGTMGAGIAFALADSGLPVAVVEQNHEAAAAGAARIRAQYEQQVKSGRLRAEDAAVRLDRIQVIEEWSAIGEADLIVEAAFEDMDVKANIFRRLGDLAKPGAVLATNTSYLDIDAIASVTKRPENVVGLHFFSPAHIMKLLEIVRGKRTSPETLATAFFLAKMMGKQPILATNCDGFIGNRIYAVYRRHAEYLLEDGASPQEIDDAMTSYGFAMGIFAASDMSGLDIAYAMRKRRAATRSPDERYVAVADALVERGHLGRKSGAGWYCYDDQGKRTPNPDVGEIVAKERERLGIKPRQFTQGEIQLRLLAVMVNEAAQELSEGIALRASDIDVAFTNGYGFPRMKGGPAWAADQIGLETILGEMALAHQAGGAGSSPAPLLARLVQTKASLANWDCNQT